MLGYLAKRVMWMVPTLVLISIISFVVIELPPGDYVSRYISGLESSGRLTSDTLADTLRARFHLNEPWYQRYGNWIVDFARGDMGYSLAWRQPVNTLLLERFALSVAVTLSALVFTWVVALPIGIYSAVRQYSVFDYVFTFIGFIGLAIPNFMLALLFMYLSYRFFGTGVGGLFSQQYLVAPWSVGRVLDLVSHLWIPMVIIGTAGTANVIRVLRANLLDELHKPYVETARAKGLPETTLLFRYPIRIAINPFISTVGWLLPELIAGEVITSVVLGLPTAGTLFLQALQQQDMYLAGSFVMLTAVLTVVGTLLSDLLLAASDPRIRYG